MDEQGGWFTDRRTGNMLCHQCVLELVTWELDGCPEPETYEELADLLPAPA